MRPATTHRTRRLRYLAAVPALVAVVALTVCSDSQPQTAPIPAPSTTPSPSPTVKHNRSLLPSGTQYAAIAKARYLSVWKRPVKTAANPEMSLDTRNPWGQQVRMLVTGAKHGPGGTPWYQVLLPVRPNDKAGWVPQSSIKLIPERERLVVDLSAFTLTWYRNGKVADRFKVGVGAPGFPTATGTFYVWATIPQPPGSPYGVYALGLSGFSNVITDWIGGGRMAIHGTAVASDQGSRVSHGCVRVYNPNMQKLRQVPLGTPVLIQH